MGDSSSVDISADKFLLEHGDNNDLLGFKSLFESTVVLSLDAMRDEEVENDSKFDD